MLAADLWQSIPDQTLSSATLHIGLSDHFRETQSFSDSVVRFETNAPLANQDFYVRLYDSSTPITVDNFLTYVADGSYDRSIIHRSADNFVIQGGGYKAPTLPADQAGSDPIPVPARPAIANEPGNANTRGTIAMAKLSGQPHSATNQWFINLRDNASLNTDNGGYTVFGEVLGGGMTVVDTLANANTYDATTYYGSGALSDLPLWNVSADNIIRPEDFVTIESVSQVNSSALLDYSVSSSRPSLATAWIDDGRLIVAQAPGASGAVEITVTARSILDGSSVSDSFVIHVAAAPLGDLPLPRMLGDLNPLANSNPMNFVESGDFVYFSTELPEQGPDGSPKAGLWRTQGTASTTVQVGTVDGQVRSLVAIPGGRVAALVETLSFSDNPDSAYPWTVTGVEVWELGSQSRLLSSLAPQAPQGEVLMGGQSLEYVDNRLLVFGTVREVTAPEWQTAYTGLWSISPASGASTFVTSWNQASPQRFWYSQGSASYGGFVYFFADEGDGFGLYRTDGTTAGTRRLRSEPDVYALLPGILGMHAEFAVLNETIVYATVVTDPVANVHVGAIAVFDPANLDPTYAGSVLTRIDRGVRPSHLTVIGDDLYFLASDPGHWDYVLNEFMPGEGTVYAFDSTTDALSSVFSTTGITAEDAQIFALSSIGDALVVGAGTMGSGQDGEPHGEIWSIRRRETSPPTLALIGSTVGENAPLGTRVGEFQITGSFPGESFSFGFAPGEGDDGNTSFTIFDNALLTGSILDFEAQATYSIRVRAEGDLGTSTEQVFTVVIDDVYEGEMQFVRIGNPGNSADPRTGSLYGEVSYEYEIGAFEITLGEYSDFLNAAAASDPYGLYHEAMATNPSVAGIQRFGSPGSYWYQVMAPAGDLSAGSQTAADRPVTYVSWYDAARFANWMHNGQGDGSTETGAYELAGMTGGGAIARNVDARFSLPTEDEWYKAAYYSPDLNSGAGGYHIYATQSDIPPGSQIGSSPNQANFFTGRHATTPATSLTYQPNQNYLTDVGAFPGSSSFYGTFDQTGNVWEWNDLDGFDGPQRGFMGGMWNSTAVHQRSDSRWVEGTWNERDNLGFRLVKLDDPASAVLNPTADPLAVAAAPGYHAERLISVPHELFIEDGLFTAVDGAVAFTTFDSSELYLVRPDLSTGELAVDAAPAPWNSGFGESLTTIERTGNTRLQKDGDGRLYVAGRPVIANGRHVTATSFAGYSPLAAETIGGRNKLLWQNQTTRQLLPWQLDANWNRISSEPPIDFPEPEDPSLAWPPVVSPAFRQIELDFGSDLNADGMIGDFHRYQYGSSTASPALYVAGGLGQVFFAQRSLGYGMEPWALPLVGAPGDRFEPNDSERDTVLLSKREGPGTITGLSLHSWDDSDVFTLEITDTATRDHFVKLVAHNMSGAGAFMDVRRLDAATGLTHHVGTTPYVTDGGASIPLTNMPAGTYFIFVNGDAVQATGGYDLEWSLPSRTVAADDFEPNDSRAEAAELVFAEANGAVAGLSLHSATDTDWFGFQFNAPPLPGDSLRLRSDGDIQASLFYAADDVPVRSTDLFWQNGVIQLGNLSPGEYFVEIQSFSGQVLEYELSWDITPPPVSDLPLPRLLADLSPNGDSWPKMFTEVGDLVYFVTSVQDGDTVLQSTLWSTDGTATAPSSIATFQGDIAAIAVQDDETLVLLINTYATEQLSTALSQHRTFRGLEIWVSDRTSTGTHKRDVLYGDNNQRIHRTNVPIFRTINGRLIAQINIETDEGVLSDLWHIDAAPTDAALPGETTDSAFMYWNGVAPPDAYVRRLPYEQGGQDKIWLFTQSSPGFRVGTMASVGISGDHDSTMIQRTSDSDGDGSAEVLLIDRALYLRFVEGLPVFSESNFIWTYEDGTQAAMPGGTKALNGRPFDTGITAVSEVRDALTAFVSSAASAASTRLVSSTSAQSAPSILSSEKAFDAQAFYFVQADGGTDSNFALNLYKTNGSPLGTEVIAQLGVPGPITLEGFADTFDIMVKGETILMAVLQSQSDAIDGAQSLVGNINVFTHDLLTHQTSTVMRGLQTLIPDSVEFSFSEDSVVLKTHEAIYRIDYPSNVLDHFQAITLATHESETILDAAILGDYVYYVTFSHSADVTASQISSLWRGYLDNRMAPERLMSHSAMTGSFFGDWPKIDLIAAENKLVFAFDESLWLLKDADSTSPVAVNRIAAPWRGDLVGMPPADETDWHAPFEVTPALGSIFFGVGSEAYGVEPWILPLAATAGDPFEPNNSPEAAWNFGPLESSGMESATIHDANDVDFYRFQTTAAGGGDHRIAISLTDSAGGDLDLELYRYVGSELQFISRAATSNSIESIPFKGLSTGDYLLKVFPHDKRANGYDLHWHLPTSTTLAPDAYEPNDTEASAFPIQITGGSFHEPLLSLHSENDVDHFRITLEATGTPDSYVQVTSDANIDVWIKDVLGDPALSMFSYFDQSNTVWGGGKISLSGVPAGEYIIGVASFAIPSDAATYGLSVHLPTPLDPSVPPDWTEPNNSQGTAFNLLTIAGQGGRDGLTLHSVPPGQSGDVDVYRFDLLPNAMVGHTIDVLFTHLQGDIDAQILDSAGNLVRRGNSLSNDETLSLAGLLPGSYFLKVFGKEGPTGESRVANTYALRWNAPLAGSTFVPDAFEPNNARSDAHDFRVVEGSFTAPGLTVHSAEDRDWYRFEITASAEARHAVEVLFSDAIGNLDARLYNSQGRRLATAATTDDHEKLSLGGLSAGVYFVEVYASANSGGGPNTYSLRLNTPSASGDHYEVNDSADQATWLGPVARGTALEDLSIHTATDSDFFRFELTTAGTWRDEIIVQFQHALGDLDVELSDADGNSVGYGASVSDDEAISLQGLPPGTYVLEVYGFGGASNDYRIEWNTPAATVVPPDPYEPLHLDPDQPETRNDAYWLGLLEGFGEFPSPSAIPFPGAIDDAVLPTIHSANDRDFWRFQTATLGGDEHAIRIASESLAGDLDLRLHRSTAPAFFDVFGDWVPEQWEVVAEADSINDIEVIRLAGLLPGDYCLEVYGFDGATNAYSINWDLPSYSTAPDRFEPNDLTATSLGELSGIFFEPELTIHSAADIDRYLVRLRAPGTFADFISVVNQDGWSGNDLFVEITPVGGGHAATTTMQWGFDAHLSLEGLPAGDYELTVSAAPWAAEFTGSTYEIHGYLSPIVDALDRDRFEANETAQHATQLRSITTETFDDLTIHTATDVDYFFFTLDAAASPTDSISVDFRHRDGDLDVELLSIGAAGEEVLRGGYSTSDNEFLELSGLGVGEYFLKVYGYAGATNEYSLRFDVQPTSVRADRLEPNNELATAHRLRTVTSFHSVETLTVHTPHDEDWFGFQTIGTGNASNFIAAASYGGGVSVDLFHSDGRPVRMDADDAFRDGFVSLDQLPAGQYFARVTGIDGHIGGYGLFLDAPSIADPPTGGGPADTADWTIMVYVTASNLFEYAFADINEMEKAVSELPGSVNITVFWDQSSAGLTYPTGGGSQPAWGGAGQAIITADTNMGSVRTSFDLLGEQNSGDPATLQRFVQWSTDSAPAENYALILWDHGAGLEGFNFDDTDGTATDHLTTEELVSALTAFSDGPTSLDLVAFDACLMGSAEVGYALRNVTDVFVASQELVGGDGYDYTTLLNRLQTSSPRDVSAEQLAAGFVRSFGEHYVGTGNWDTHSAIRTAGYDALASTLREFSSALQAAEMPVKRAVASAIGFAHTFNFDYLRDLGAFMARVSGHGGVSSVVQNAASAVSQALDALVVAKTSDSRQSSGLSIYMPTANSEPHAWYSQDYAAFLEATDWGNALAALQQGGGPNTRADWLTGGRNALNAFDLGVVGGIGNVFGGLSLFDAADVDWLRFEIRGGNTSADANLGITVTTNEAAVLSATLYDATGTVEYGTLTDGRIPFDSLPNGIYSLKISSNTGVRDYDVTIDAPALTNSQGRSVGANDSERKAENWGVIAGTRLQSGLTLPPRPLSSPDGGWRYFEFSAPRLPGALDWALTLSTPDGVAVEGELFRKRNDLLEAMGATSDATGPTLSYHSFGESETFVLRVRQSAVNASPAAFRVQFERGSSQELISPVERTGAHRLGRNAVGNAFSNTTQIQYGNNPLPMRFNGRWDIIDAEVVDGKNFVFAQAGSDGPRYRMVADAEWRIAGMESIGNAENLAIRRPTMRVDSEQRVFAEDIPVLFADGSSILREPEAGWQAIAIEPVSVGDSHPISLDNRMLLRSLSNEDLFRIWSFGDDWRFDREIPSSDLPDAGQLERDFFVDLNGNRELGV